MSDDLDHVMRTLWDSRSIFGATTDEKWEQVKQSPVHRVTLRCLREEAMQMIQEIQAGEFG